jgi:hypothetical protein
MHLYLDAGKAALPDIGNFLVVQTAADDQGENIPLIIAKLCHGGKDSIHPLLGNIALFLSWNRLMADFSPGDESFVESHLIVEKIPGHGKEQCRTLFAGTISFQIAGKGLLDKIGGQMDIAGLAEKIAKEFVPIIDIELFKSDHSVVITDFFAKGYRNGKKRSPKKRYKVLPCPPSLCKK